MSNEAPPKRRCRRGSGSVFQKAGSPTGSFSTIALIPKRERASESVSTLGYRAEPQPRNS